MDHLIYTAMTGANAAASRQAILSNNLANASTNGFRAQLETYRAVPIQGQGASTRVFAAAFRICRTRETERIFALILFI